MEKKEESEKCFMATHVFQQSTRVMTSLFSTNSSTFIRLTAWYLLIQFNRKLNYNHPHTREMTLMLVNRVNHSLHSPWDTQKY